MRGAEGALLWRARALLAGVLLCLAPIISASELAILTGGTSGVYYPIGQQLEVLLEEAIPEHRFRVVSTQASVENLNLLQRGAGVLALAQGDTLADAWAGRQEAGFAAARHRIRLVGAAYPDFIHLLARKDSGIAALEDLAGKRVSVGASRSGTEISARAILGAAGLSYADLLQVEYLHYGESVEQLVSGELDAVIISAGLGVAAVGEAARRTAVLFVPIPPNIMTASTRFQPIAIPPGSYPGQVVAVPTAALNNFFVTSADLSEALVYRITRAIYDNLDRIHVVHPAARAISLERALAIRPVEVHPGALRYFRELGLAESP
ncbi:TAXI family TRAP transporter solute-binding subunit [Halomonas daqiaonensis]|uniref:TRAP transporter solute receptor, TAXI family n=1 Tax=Halomonas daqiaonensis TaxID=650850 RepID=A0A1H7L5Z7_9GAMM|nr:TAXI family TRAP transporter solute-binding subunit [Halomonas daqiaonensis]SEK94230.1 hypothetical protein SAMN04488129_105178 [Halomonas daqiaonensis]